MNLNPYVWPYTTQREVAELSMRELKDPVRKNSTFDPPLSGLRRRKKLRLYQCMSKETMALFGLSSRRLTE